LNRIPSYVMIITAGVPRGDGAGKRVLVGEEAMNRPSREDLGKRVGVFEQVRESRSG